MDRGDWQAIVRGVAESDTTDGLTLSTLRNKAPGLMARPPPRNRTAPTPPPLPGSTHTHTHTHTQNAQQISDSRFPCVEATALSLLKKALRLMHAWSVTSVMSDPGIPWPVAHQAPLPGENTGVHCRPSSRDRTCVSYVSCLSGSLPLTSPGNTNETGQIAFSWKTHSAILMNYEVINWPLTFSSCTTEFYL